MIEIDRATGETRVPEVSAEDRTKLWAALAAAMLEKEEEDRKQCR